MIESMSFIEVIGPKENFDPIVDALQKSGVMHIEEIPIGGWSKTAFLNKIHLSEEEILQSKTYEELANVLAEEGIAHLPKHLVAKLRDSKDFHFQYQKYSDCDDATVVSQARSTHAQVRSFMRRKRNLDDDVRTLAVYEELIEAIVPLLKNYNMPKEFEYVGVIFDKKNIRARNLLKQQIEKITSGQCQFVQAHLQGGRVAAVIGFHKHNDRQARQFIDETSVSEIHGPKQYRNKPFAESLITAQEDLARLKSQQQKLSKQMEEFFAQKAALLLALKAVCDDRLSRFKAITKFAQTQYTFIVQGWVPTLHLKTLSKAIESLSEASIIIRHLHSRETANSAPVRLSNPGPVQPFEYLLSLFPLPKYGTIDPTSYVAAFFPPMFGLMLADIGYGLIIAAGALYFRFRKSSGHLARALGTVFSWCALYAIIFGFVFGEFFGTAGHHLGLRPLWQERLVLEGPGKTGALIGYLMLAIGVGIAHTMCGLLLGISNARKMGEKGKVLECSAKIAGLIGLFFIIARLANVLPPAFSTVGIAALIAFFVLMVFATLHHPMHGLILPLELLSTVGNVLSYARIMAVGMASAVLALLANQLGGAASNMVLSIIIIVLFHALNLVLGIVDPTIQGLRLHYVEFFSKFYSTGGRVYSPFRMKGNSL